MTQFANAAECQINTVDDNSCCFEVKWKFIESNAQMLEKKLSIYW